jgi:hypothetical protein
MMLNLIVIHAAGRQPDKHSAADPITTSVMKQDVDLTAPFLAELFNHSPAAGHFPAGFKEAFIIPLVKKPGLNTVDINSYRPKSNLSMQSKLLERLVVRQLMHLTSADLLSSLQSGFRLRFECCRVILQVVDHGDVAALILFDLSIYRQHFIRSTTASCYSAYMPLTVVSVAPARSFSICAPWFVEVFNYAPDMRRSSRFGAGTGVVCSSTPLT